MKKVTKTEKDILTENKKKFIKIYNTHNHLFKFPNIPEGVEGKKSN